APGFVFSTNGGPYVLLFSDYQISESYAAFADVTYHLGKKWHFTLGGRLSDDSAQASRTGYTTNPPVTVNAPKKTWGSFTPRAVVRYSLTPDSNAYISFSQGFKAGLYNAASLNGQLTPVAPEHLTDVEGGYKIARHDWNL